MDLPLILFESMAYKQMRVGRKVWRQPPPESVKKQDKDLTMAKIKIKTHRGAAKRFRKTASGK
ncbi:MAG TPA: bL35 family ribosomal protein, partial [Arenimonas sp.]|nr:bL35 family ribosomal protein [Arenimonas sp.]